MAPEDRQEWKRRLAAMDVKIAEIERKTEMLCGCLTSIPEATRNLYLSAVQIKWLAELLERRGAG